MDLLLILTYTAFCIAIFKIFKIPLNKWTVPTAFLGGVVLIGSLLMLMNYNHPHTKFAREYFVSIPINPSVRGKVVSVEVEPNTQIKQGEVLFRLDPEPFEAVVKQLEAKLVAAKVEVPQLNAIWKSAEASTAKITADRDRSKLAYERYKKGAKAGSNSPFSEIELDNRKQLYMASEAQLAAAQAEELRAKLAYESNIGGVNTKVADIEAQLQKAQFDLEQTIVRAPVDGLVTQMALREGMIAVPMPLRPLMSFIPDEERYFAGAFWQNSLLRLSEGDQAEIILDAAPGRVYQGKVKKILPAMAEGEVQSNGNLQSSDRLFRSGRVIVLIDVDDAQIKHHFPAGVSGQAAVYTDHVSHVAVMRKVLLRMQAWLNYLFI